MIFKDLLASSLENDNVTLKTIECLKVKLTLPISSMSHILMFLNRPFRIAKYIIDTELEPFWSKVTVYIEEPIIEYVLEI
jgi:hypothetical protein